ncbi:DUF397 domain-containing protein [Streptomyces durocortorensis]|uniref:DUF397 domain-containing protein n=1 Tax=Streptomyces durocortorensis TaxID=2811104 RepID=A0ABS2HWK9_9ACTN|nr:DUF397 domain-containing protein [Streptomyces durocortorensis]MBM7055406.1 DUF397 domain-containing protein [Streptomyces durocortorensis]
MSRKRPQAVPESAWFKSSYSSGEGGECLEVAALAAQVHIRDSKVTAGPQVSVGTTAWATFVRLAAD